MAAAIVRVCACARVSVCVCESVCAWVVFSNAECELRPRTERATRRRWSNQAGRDLGSDWRHGSRLLAALSCVENCCVAEW